ncbi:hypothetical protein HPB52_009073 [Rhipicephalus sanguineus]|uniref:Endonuclease/exonuclease/phosphatase domain-containing protein n=1 Tax=Rhipicephalus sanguineus TaxID=34632 RepID=A0A9D4SZS3_RHISA|nr:hypothetical protein HPB52_009073 [Rhipicephalus sanguineus]
MRTQGVKIERARMLGSSKTAIITFTGSVLPRSVYIMGAELICYPYKPTVQVCKICLLTGHRTDVCPTPNVNVCLKCGAREPTQGHDCTPKCVICDGEHPTGDRLCKKKHKSVAPPRKSRIDQTKERGGQPEWTGDVMTSGEFPQLELHKPRCLKNQTIGGGPLDRAGSPQETEEAQASGRTNTYQSPNYPRIATLVSKMIAAKAEYVESLKINHQIISLFPQKRGKPRTIIVNVYSPPRDKCDDFSERLAETFKVAGNKDRLLVLGAFNAPNTTWGYTKDSPKGRRLEHAASRLGLSLITLPTAPTRVGNSVSRDTFPDLTFTFNIKDASWNNLEENLGSDHYIISVSISTPKMRRVIGDATITDWTEFRKRDPPPDSVPDSIAA